MGGLSSDILGYIGIQECVGIGDPSDGVSRDIQGFKDV